MRYAFSTLVCPDWTWEEILTAASDLGYDGVELRGVGKEIYLPQTSRFSDAGIDKVVSELKRLKLSVPCLATGALLFDASLISLAQHEIADYIKLAVKLNTPYVRLLADRNPAPGIVDEDAVLQNLKLALPEAEKAGVTLLVETNGVYADSDRMRALLEKINSPALGVVWDVHHSFRYAGEEPAKTFENIGKYIKHVHLKDSIMENGVTHYRMMGYGDVPYADAVKLLEESGFDGFLTCEWVKRWNTELEEPGIVLPHFISVMKR